MNGQRIWTAALLVIGDEILSGRTQDKNVAQIASWLNVQGIRLSDFDRRKNQDFWRGLQDLVPQWDELITAFNRDTGMDVAAA